MKRIGILGCGSIGSQIAIAIDTGIIPAKLTHIFDENRKIPATGHPPNQQ